MRFRVSTPREVGFREKELVEFLEFAKDRESADSTRIYYEARRISFCRAYGVAFRLTGQIVLGRLGPAGRNNYPW